MFLYVKSTHNILPENNGEVENGACKKPKKFTLFQAIENVTSSA